MSLIIIFYLYTHIYEKTSDKLIKREYMTYQFKIQIKGITKPPVWRRVLVPDIYTFLRFH